MPSFWWQCTWNMPIILVAVHLEYAVILVAMHLEYARHFGGSVPGICRHFLPQVSKD